MANRESDRNSYTEQQLREGQPWHYTLAIEQCSNKAVARIARRVREEQET
jgi:hypothetical protein